MNNIYENHYIVAIWSIPYDIRNAYAFWIIEYVRPR